VLDVIGADDGGDRGRHRHEPVGEIERISWHDAMTRYGSDKPDVRFGMELVELTDVFAETGFNAFKAPSHQGHQRVPGRRRAHGRNASTS
jgi:aspartyl-tRNA synthetase